MTKTIGDLYRPAMEITDQTEADAYFETLVAYAMKHHGTDRATAEKNERSNLGYFSGYYDNKTAERVFRLFRCAHPIFGTSRPSVAEAIEAGKKEATK